MTKRVLHSYKVRVPYLFSLEVHMHMHDCDDDERIIVMNIRW